MPSYILGYRAVRTQAPRFSNGFFISWDIGSRTRPRRARRASHAAAPALVPPPRLPTPRLLISQGIWMVSYPAACPAARTPLPPLRRPRQSLALRPSVRVTMSRLVPPFASRRSRHATHAKASHSVPAFAPRCPGSSRRPHSAAPVTPSAPRRLAPPRALRTGLRHPSI